MSLRESDLEHTGTVITLIFDKDHNCVSNEIRVDYQFKGIPKAMDGFVRVPPVHSTIQADTHEAIATAFPAKYISAACAEGLNEAVSELNRRKSNKSENVIVKKTFPLE